MGIGPTVNAMTENKNYSARILAMRRELKHGGKTDKTGKVVQTYDGSSESPICAQHICNNRK